jgi:uridine kinase
MKPQAAGTATASRYSRHDSLGTLHPYRQFRRGMVSESECRGCAAALPLLRAAGEALGRPVLVGIGGPGGSGKSSFSAAIARHLDGVRIVPLDDYRKPRAERGFGIHGSHPAGNRIELLKSHLEAARDGRPFERPVFCRVRGAAWERETIHPARFILADGEIAAHRGLRDCFDVRILVLAGWPLQWRARMGRDRSERATSLRKALALFCISNLLDYPRFSAGMEKEADLVLRRTRCGRLLTPCSVEAAH